MSVHNRPFVISKLNFAGFHKITSDFSGTCPVEFYNLNNCHKMYLSFQKVFPVVVDWQARCVSEVHDLKCRIERDSHEQQRVPILTFWRKNK